MLSRSKCRRALLLLCPAALVTRCESFVLRRFRAARGPCGCCGVPQTRSRKMPSRHRRRPCTRSRCLNCLGKARQVEGPLLDRALHVSRPCLSHFERRFGRLASIVSLKRANPADIDHALRLHVLLTPLMGQTQKLRQGFGLAPRRLRVKDESVSCPPSHLRAKGK
jgi:hypothetical protein